MGHFNRRMHRCGHFEKCVRNSWNASKNISSLKEHISSDTHTHTHSHRGLCWMKNVNIPSELQLLLCHGKAIHISNGYHTYIPDENSTCALQILVLLLLPKQYHVVIRFSPNILQAATNYSPTTTSTTATKTTTTTTEIVACKQASNQEYYISMTIKCIITQYSFRMWLQLYYRQCGSHTPRTPHIYPFWFPFTSTYTAPAAAAHISMLNIYAYTYR